MQVSISSNEVPEGVAISTAARGVVRQTECCELEILNYTFNLVSSTVLSTPY